MDGDGGRNGLDAGASNDTLVSLQGENILSGNDVINASGAVNDSIVGRGTDLSNLSGSGEDFFDGGGGEGSDRLFGDSGADVFHFDRGEGNDRVMDFENNIDTIEFDNFAGFSGESDALAFAEEVGPHVFFDFGTDGTLLVENTMINRLVNDIDIV